MSNIIDIILQPGGMFGIIYSVMLLVRKDLKPIENIDIAKSWEDILN